MWSSLSLYEDSPYLFILFFLRCSIIIDGINNNNNKSVTKYLVDFKGRWWDSTYNFATSKTQVVNVSIFISCPLEMTSKTTSNLFKLVIEANVSKRLWLVLLLSTLAFGISRKSWSTELSRSYIIYSFSLIFLLMYWLYLSFLNRTWIYCFVIKCWFASMLVIVFFWEWGQCMLI